jgi:hypothetical protein
MRPFNVKLLGCIGLLIGLAGIIGCGSSDLLDEVGQRYSATVEIQDFSDIDLGIDIAQDDCDLDATTTDDGEDYGPAIANVTISVATNTPGITLQSYTIEYIPQLSSTGDAGTPTLMPTDLEDPLPGVYNIDIASGGSKTFSITCMSVDTKQEYRNEQGWVWFNDGVNRYWIAPILSEGRYTIRFTFTFLNTEGQTEIITKSATVWLGDFDNC